MTTQHDPSDTTPMRRLTLGDVERALAGPAAAHVEPFASTAPAFAIDERGRCSLCDGAGYYYARPAGSWTSYDLRRCPCMAAADAEKRAAEQRAARAGRLAKLATELGSLARCTFDNFALGLSCPAPVAFGGITYAPAEQVRSVALARRIASTYAEQPAGWLALVGPVGSGKSHLAAAVANAYGERGEVAYASTPAMLRYIRAGFADRTADARLEDLIAVDLLVLDDIGAEQLTGWSEPLVYDLLNARYLAERPTVLTTNLTRDELPPRIASRMSAACGERQYVSLVAYDRRRLSR